MTPAGSGLDLSQTKEWYESAPVCIVVVLDQLGCELFVGVVASAPLNGDSRTGAGLRARNSFLAYLLSAPLFSVGTMSWRMKRARSRMS